MKQEKNMLNRSIAGYDTKSPDAVDGVRCYGSSFGFRCQPDAR